MAEQAGYIPKEMSSSMNFSQVKIDVINYIFSGAIPDENSSMEYKDANGKWQEVSGKRYQEMVKDVGARIYNKEVGVPYKNIEVPKN